MRLLPQLTMPLQTDIGIGAQLVDDPCLQGCQLLGGAPWNGLRLDMTRLAMLFEIALDGGQGHSKQLDNFCSGIALLDCIYHSLAQIF